MSDTPRTDEAEYYYSNHDSCAGESLYRVIDDKDVTWDDQYSGFSVTSKFARQLERELAEARDQLAGAGKLMKACDVLVRDLAEVREQRDRLAEAMIPAMTRAYARGYNHGHEDTVESTFMTTHASDELTFFADDIRQMLLDGSQPEAQAALAAVKGASHE